MKYFIDVEQGFPRSRQHFVAKVKATLTDPRSWNVPFEEVTKADEADIRIFLVRSSTIKNICNFSGLSCADRSTRNIYINGYRWLYGSKRSKMNLDDYRSYVINHEVGHLLGLDHLKCSGKAGKKAPVMLQQTLGVGKCLPNPFPTTAERNLVKR